jgi:hypothetical protein
MVAMVSLAIFLSGSLEKLLLKLIFTIKKLWDYAVDKQSGGFPQMTQMIADKSQKICVHRRSLRMEMVLCLSCA